MIYIYSVHLMSLASLMTKLRRIRVNFDQFQKSNFSQNFGSVVWRHFGPSVGPRKSERMNLPQKCRQRACPTSRNAFRAILSTFYFFTPSVLGRSLQIMNSMAEIGKSPISEALGKIRKNRIKSKLIIYYLELTGTI